MVKVCRKCNISKPMDQFCRDKQKSDGHRTICKLCQCANAKDYKRRLSQGVVTNFSKQVKNRIDSGLKICKMCLFEKPFSFFQKDKAAPDGHRSPCKDCRKKNRIDYKSQVKSRYGLSWDELLSNLGNQNFLCLICKDSICLDNLNVDHDHSTGSYRGLLCGPCNRGLGHFRDNISILEGAIDYLEGAMIAAAGKKITEDRVNEQKAHQQSGSKEHK